MSKQQCKIESEIEARVIFRIHSGIEMLRPMHYGPVLSL